MKADGCARCQISYPDRHLHLAPSSWRNDPQVFVCASCADLLWEMAPDWEKRSRMNRAWLSMGDVVEVEGASLSQREEG